MEEALERLKAKFPDIEFVDEPDSVINALPKPKWPSGEKLLRDMSPEEIESLYYGSWGNLDGIQGNARLRDCVQRALDRMTPFRPGETKEFPMDGNQTVIVRAIYDQARIMFRDEHDFPFLRWQESEDWIVKNK